MLLRPLTAWFRDHGADARVEIEARLRSVSSDEWAYMHRKLSSFSGWQTRLDEDTADSRYAGDIRVTARGGGAAPEVIAKETLAHVDAHLVDGVSLRLVLAAEDAAPLPRAGAPLLNVRFKARSRFCLPGGIAFDLTRVRLGASHEAAAASPMSYEAEVEWCGQAASAGAPLSSEALARDFLLKVEDLVNFQRRARQLAHEAAAAAAAPAAAPASAPPTAAAPAPAATQASVP